MRSIILLGLAIVASACEPSGQKEIAVPPDNYAPSLPDRTFRLSEDKRARLGVAFDTDALEELFRRYPAETREVAIQEFILLADQVASGNTVITDMRSLQSGDAEIDALLKKALSKRTRLDVQSGR